MEKKCFTSFFLSFPMISARKVSRMVLYGGKYRPTKKDGADSLTSVTKEIVCEALFPNSDRSLPSAHGGDWGWAVDLLSIFLFHGRGARRWSFFNFIWLLVALCH